MKTVTGFCIYMVNELEEKKEVMIAIGLIKLYGICYVDKMHGIGILCWTFVFNKNMKHLPHNAENDSTGTSKKFVIMFVSVKGKNLIVFQTAQNENMAPRKYNRSKSYQ